jgi:hypothetical protein
MTTALEPGPGDRILSEKRAAKNRRNTIVAGSVLSVLALVIIISIVASYESDEQILNHMADCTLAKGYLVMQALGAKSTPDAEMIRNLKSHSITDYTRMADEYQLKHPGDTKRNYLKAVELAACQ